MTVPNGMFMGVPESGMGVPNPNAGNVGGTDADAQCPGDGTPLRVFRSGRLPAPRGRRDIPPGFRLAGALAARIEHVAKRLRVKHVFGPGLKIGRGRFA